jgi:hypothetical protein
LSLSGKRDGPLLTVYPILAAQPPVGPSGRTEFGVHHREKCSRQKIKFKELSYFQHTKK